jgi:hypothetical protein
MVAELEVLAVLAVVAGGEFGRGGGRDTGDQERGRRCSARGPRVA